MHSKTLFYAIPLLLLLTILSGTSNVTAQTSTLSNNSGDGNSSWFIDGERTLVINGFDLGPRNLAFPITVDSLSISVQQAVPGASVDMVVYTDDNGGSPIDAALVGRTQVTIDTAGTATFAFPEPVVINSPVIWIGFYLPIDFRFYADTSGSSVLTYWAWTPSGTFDLADLGSAAVFGPSDGSSPVNLDLGGVARITAQISQNADGQPSVVTDGDTSGDVVIQGNPGDIGIQLQSQTNANLSVLDQYPYCGELLFYDPEDVGISARGAFRMHCRADLGSFSPGRVINEDEIATGITTMERRAYLYEVFAGGNYQMTPENSEKLRVPVTHCIRPDQIDLEEAVIGIAYGAPRQWEILPSVRYGELVCAEVTHIGFISYFIPRTGGEPTANADLYFVGRVRIVDPNEPNNDSIRCRFNYEVQYAIRNEGFEATPQLTLQIQDIHIRTGTVAKEVTYTIPPIPAGETVNFTQFNFEAPSIYTNEAHRMYLRLDAGNQLAELNELNNQYILEYILETSRRCL